ncbi:MAG: ABC transporter permease [Candidatus Bathyarchaeota archaeon]|nr:ABC transporter permease [Candidatus Bathyarchaeota archaeon]
MKAPDILSYAWGGIRLRKLRAALTTLGVVIGITAIVALLSLGEGFQVVITSQFERGFALDVLTVTAGRGFGSLVLPHGAGGGPSEFYLIINDTQAINRVENVKLSTAILSKSVILSSSSTTLMASAAGVNFAEYSEIYSGTFLAENGSIPLTPANDTVVLGARRANPWENGTVFARVGDAVNLTWTTGPITNPVTKSFVFHVAAVLGEIGGFGIGGPSDNQVYIPLSTAQTIFETDEVDQILVQIVDSRQSTIDSVSNAIRSEELFDDKVTIISPTAMLNTFSSVLSTVQLLLAGLAGISLLVAGIGIMNIMIVSVLERTREIGILKSLGMKNRTVLVVFLSEAALVGFLGAVIGIGLGWGLSNFFARFGLAMMGGATGVGPMGGRGVGAVFSIVPVLTPAVFLGALVFGVATSVLFGLYPAWRASKLKPVEALRYE